MERGVAVPGKQRQRAPHGIDGQAAQKRRGSLGLEIFLKMQRLRS
jgi:hypothetical protein